MSFEWAVMRPGIFGKIFFIAAGARVTPWLAGFNAGQPLALLADPTFKEHRDLNGGMEGLKAARDRPARRIAVRRASSSRTRTVTTPSSPARRSCRHQTSN